MIVKTEVKHCDFCGTTAFVKSDVDIRVNLIMQSIKIIRSDRTNPVVDICDGCHDKIKAFLKDAFPKFSVNP